MALEQLLQIVASEKPPAPKLISPTLIIGLGGTGKDVLLRLRRRLVERYGSLSKLKFLQFVHVDTDATPTAHEQYDVRAADDPLYQEIRFSPSDRLGLKITGGTNKYVDHINNYPHIKRWFPTGGKIANLGDLGNGAGQVRIASRLGFFDAENFNRISERLVQAKKQLSDANILDRSLEYGFQFEPKSMNVFVIASLAGGTGSGTFLDMGFLAQQHFPDADRAGILFLPAFFSGYPGAERMRANGFAALMELNHYSFGHSFIGDWGGGRPATLSPPPFTTTYLIDGINEARVTIGSSGGEFDAYQMVAEILYQDYSINTFAGLKRAVRVNLENFNLNVYTHKYLNDALRRVSRGTDKILVGETYPTRFGSMGLAAISFPTDRVHGACASRLAVRILEFWQKNLLEDPLDRLITAFLSHEDVRFVQGRYERRDGGGVIERSDIEDALQVWDEPSGRTFASYLWQKAQDVRTALEAAPNGQRGSTLLDQRNLLDQAFAKEDSELPEEWGVAIRRIEQNMREYVDRTKNGIQSRAAETANNPQFGVAYTLSMLRELKALLKNEIFKYQHHFEAEIPVWRDEVQTYAFALDKLQLDIAKHEKRMLFRAEDLKRDFEKLVGPEGAEDPGAFYSYYMARVRKQVAKRGKQVCEEIDAFLGADDPTGEGLIGSYYQLLVGFGKLKSRLADKERYFSRPLKSVLTVSLYREGDVDEWYKTWVGEGTRETDTLRLLGNQILEGVFKVNSVMAALARIQTTPAAEVEAAVLEHCRRFLEKHAKQPDALSLLFDANRFSAERRREQVSLAYRLSKVWLTRPERGLDHTELPPVRSGQRPNMIGLRSDGPFVEEFKELVHNISSADDSPAQFLDLSTQNRGMIVFYNELAGVPAFYASSISVPQGLRAAYDGWQDKEDLHTDKNRFQFGDLIPKDENEIRRYEDSLKAFVLARLLGILRVREVAADDGRPLFDYSFTRSYDLHAEEVILGDELHAVDYLYRDRRPDHLSDRHALLQAVQEAVNTLQAHSALWLYPVLIEFYLSKVYEPIDLPDSVVQYSPEYAVLAVVRDQVPQLVGGPAERTQLETALRNKRGKSKEEALTYDEFRAVLGPYCKTAGKFADRAQKAAIYRQTEWRDVLALDITKIDKTLAKEPPKPVQRAAAAPVVVDPKIGTRGCPNCGKEIDRRAAFCVHCKQTIATHVTCPSCGEAHVPSDLENCWKCGSRMRTDPKISCPQCYAWEGYPEEFPCKQCGYDPNKPPEPDRASAVAPGADSFGAAAASGNGSTPPEPVADSTPGLVQCPMCYSMVKPGPQCPVCAAVLQI